MRLRANLPLLCFLLVTVLTVAGAGRASAQASTDVHIRALAIVGTTLTITGYNFGASAPMVQVGDGTAIVSSSSDTEIVAETGALTPGTHLVTVTRDSNAGGSATSTLRIR